MFFKSLEYNVLHSIINLKENFELLDLVEMIDEVLEQYLSKKIDKVFLVYNKFNNTICYTPIITQLLPIHKLDLNKNKKKQIWDYIYESNSKLLLDTVLNRYIKFKIYQSVLENLLCEQAARMLAMKKATDNSTDLIKGLEMYYNKERQSSITQELIEIVSGASAVSLN